MSSATEGLVSGPKWESFLQEIRESLARAMSEARVDHLIAQMWDANSGTTVDVSGPSTLKLTQLHTQLELEFPLKIVLSIPHWLLAENVQNSLSTQGLRDSSTTTRTVTPEDFDC